VRMLDLFCGRFGWSRAFAARGWECVGVDLVEPPEIPEGCRLLTVSVEQIEFDNKANEFICWSAGRHSLGNFDFICASSPCEQFSVHGMKHFHPNPPYPELGIRLFNHTRELCEKSGAPYCATRKENVNEQDFVGFYKPFFARCLYQVSGARV
jgi:site-specific DNA-cytosine methylase